MTEETKTLTPELTEIFPTPNAQLLHILYKSWPDEIELLKANFTAQGVEAQIRFKDQVYVLEIRPDE